MKRYGNLWPKLTSFEHLLHSFEKAKRGKRLRPAVARYEFALEVFAGPSIALWSVC